MIALIILVRFLSQPWRGIVDAGIVAGLSWGFIALLAFSLQAFTVGEFKHSLQLPT